MRVLVLNAGSSSLKASIVEDGATVARAEHSFGADATTSPGQPAVVRDVLASLGGAGVGAQTIEAVGHRVVHGGATFSQPTSGPWQRSMRSTSLRRFTTRSRSPRSAPRRPRFPAFPTLPASIRPFTRLCPKPPPVTRSRRAGMQIGESGASGSTGYRWRGPLRRPASSWGARPGNWHSWSRISAVAVR